MDAERTCDHCGRKIGYLEQTGNIGSFDSRACIDCIRESRKQSRRVAAWMNGGRKGLFPAPPAPAEIVGE